MPTICDAWCCTERAGGIGGGSDGRRWGGGCGRGRGGAGCHGDLISYSTIALLVIFALLRGGFVVRQQFVIDARHVYFSRSG